MDHTKWKHLVVKSRPTPCVYYFFIAILPSDAESDSAGKLSLTFSLIIAFKRVGKFLLFLKKSKQNLGQLLVIMRIKISFDLYKCARIFRLSDRFLACLIWSTVTRACCSIIWLLIDVDKVLRLLACPFPVKSSTKVFITLLEMLVDVDVDDDCEILITEWKLSSAIDTDAAVVDMELSLKELGSVGELVVLGRSRNSSFDTFLYCSFCVTESGNGVDSRVPVFCHLFTFCYSKGLCHMVACRLMMLELFLSPKYLFRRFP